MCIFFLFKVNYYDNFIILYFPGNIWAQSWNNLEKFTRPYPEKPDVDVTAALINQVFDTYFCHVTGKQVRKR